MGSIELANIYMSCFFGEKLLEEMNNVLAEDLKFIEPLYEFSSAQEYIQSLKENPPTDVSHEILQEFENENSSCLVYRYKKPGVNTTVAQLFEVKENRILKIRLIFDASKFPNN